MRWRAVCWLPFVACAPRDAAPAAPTEPVVATTGERCPHGCSVGEICIRTLGRGGAREERCDVVPDDCASPEVMRARAELAAAEHDHERQKELHEFHATSTADLEVAEDAERKARAELARAEYSSVPRCNRACTAAVCGAARCVGAPGVIECVSK